MEKLIIASVLALITAAAAFILVYLGRRRGALSRRQRSVMRRIFLSSAFLLVLELLPRELFDMADAALPASAGELLRFVLYMAVYLIIGGDILKKSLHGIINGRVFDECFLMTVATLGAVALAIAGDGDYFEAVAVMLFYQIGEWFQSYAVGRSRKSIASLMDIRPDSANLERDGELVCVAPEDVPCGSIIVVRPGERVPIDGIVTDGISSLNTSALTGESLPRTVAVGDRVISGCINMTGVLKLCTDREASESTVARIMALVESAADRKAKSESFISRFARVYTPAVCAAAAALALLAPAVSVLLLSREPMWRMWLYRALTFLVISCPCALVISIPMSFFAGIGCAGRAGILIKGSSFIESLARSKCMLFDKTGTLTRGVFEVTKIVPSSCDEDSLLTLVALAERDSSHPIAESLRRAYASRIKGEADAELADRTRVTDICELAGCGICATVDGTTVCVGNEKLMHRLGLNVPDITKGAGVVHASINGEYGGYIVISDIARDGAADTVSALRGLGVKRTVMLTGDARSSAESLAESLDIKEYYSELLPEDKAQMAEKLKGTLAEGEKLAFVGDGLNDAPVLALADVGIAMGGIGSDAAVEAADVVLMDDDIRKIARAVAISKKCMRIVHENIVLALGVKLICLVLGAVGLANMYLAIFADVGVMVLAVLNAMRCLIEKRIK